MNVAFGSIAAADLSNLRVCFLNSGHSNTKVQGQRTAHSGHSVARKHPFSRAANSRKPTSIAAKSSWFDGSRWAGSGH